MRNEHIGPEGATLRHRLWGAESPIHTVHWIGDASYVLTVSNLEIRLWNHRTGLLEYVNRRGQTNVVALSNDAKQLAIALQHKVEINDVRTGKLLFELGSIRFAVTAMQWSDRDHLLAIGDMSGGVTIWDFSGKADMVRISGNGSSVTALKWAANESHLIVGDADGNILTWDPFSGRIVASFPAHSGSVTCLTLSQAGLLLSASTDAIIRIWESISGNLKHVIEGHDAQIHSIYFLKYSNLLVSIAKDNTLRLWRPEVWDEVARYEEKSPWPSIPKNALNPENPIMMTLSEVDTVGLVWDVDIVALTERGLSAQPVYYRNAKIVLVGDTGVGKSGLALVLTGQQFAPTDSTHARRVWTFSTSAVEIEDKRVETREVLLWDLAGQPGYRLIHQLSLTDVAAALVLFDARSETDPFSGVRHWERALAHASRVQSSSSAPVSMLLVAARIDRGGVGVSKVRIERVVKDLSFRGFYETSAKEGWGVDELIEAINQSIPWDDLPPVTSTAQFQRIKQYLLDEKQAGRLLSTADDLFRSFAASSSELKKSSDLRRQFDTCVGRVESRGLIRRLSFGDLVLLQPELLDAYASAIVNAAKSEPDGLGCIAEEDALNARFPMSTEERINDRDLERLLLIATVEELLSHDIALREHADVTYLVFPSQFTRDWPEAPEPDTKAMVLTFEGPVTSIYTTLCVRLSRSLQFSIFEMWRNTAIYTSLAGGKCGMSVRELEEGKGQLMLFYEESASVETRLHFEQYVITHLSRRALPESIKQRRSFYCFECATPISDIVVDKRRERGFDWLECSVCGTRVTLDQDSQGMLSSTAGRISAMDLVANIRRDREVANARIRGKEATSDYDVLLCFNSKIDFPAAEVLAEALRSWGILACLPESRRLPGKSVVEMLEEEPSRYRTAVVMIADYGLSAFRNREMRIALREYQRDGGKIIPVLLPGSATTELPDFLVGMSWVNFRRRDPDPMQRLIWSVSGEHSKYVNPGDQRLVLPHGDLGSTRGREYSMQVMAEQFRGIEFREWAGASSVTLTVVFTDLVSSTAIGRDVGNEVMNQIRRAHFTRVRKVISSLGGFEVKTIGDAFMVVFRNCSDAMRFALALRGDSGDSRLRVRAGLHVGPVIIDDDDAFGSMVNYASRVVSKSRGPGIWISNRVKEYLDEEKVQEFDGLSWKAHRGLVLKGFPGSHLLWSLETPKGIGGE